MNKKTQKKYSSEPRMPLDDIFIVFRWWGALFLLGAAAFPLTKRLFFSWHDEGYLFSKAVGLSVVTWIVYVLGMGRIASFGMGTILCSVGFVFLLGILLKSPKELKLLRWKTIVTEEVFFLSALIFWSFIKAHEPSIRGLEKFMDYGFMQSILNSGYFPPADMWYPPHPINYYYFGHLVTALLTKLSGLDLAYTFNLMLATIFALCLTMSYSIGRELTKKIGGGLLTAFLVTLAGNMQTIYAFTKGYTGEDVKPFWELGWTLEGLSTYWYANATRFIPWTIHEFPSYSFAVSDVHGHVLSIPFVLLAIGLILNKKIPLLFYGFLCGVLLMTNALDGPIYFALLIGVLVIPNIKYSNNPIIQSWKHIVKKIVVVLCAMAVTGLPFLSHFKSFVNGLAVNCPLPMLANSTMGPILFEGVEKCQRSPFWMMWVLWGFFIFCGMALFLKRKFTQIEKILLIFFGFSILLILFPELFYFKDIYPQHFRSNTMFKLGYQAFMMFSIVSAYAIMTVKNKIFYLILIPQLFLVSIYPYFSVRSYFGGLRNYEGLYGFTWLAREYPDNYQAMLWLKEQPLGGIVEADGDSYTDYEQFSVVSGRSTIIGWAVHEWLWRGTYDVVSPRREEVRQIYELEDEKQTKEILEKYDVRYIIVGKLEREKFTGLHEDKLSQIGGEVFRANETVVYDVTR